MSSVLYCPVVDAAPNKLRIAAQRHRQAAARAAAAPTIARLNTDAHHLSNCVDQAHERLHSAYGHDSESGLVDSSHCSTIATTSLTSTPFKTPASARRHLNVNTASGQQQQQQQQQQQASSSATPLPFSPPESPSNGIQDSFPSSPKQSQWRSTKVRQLLRSSRSPKQSSTAAETKGLGSLMPSPISLRSAKNSNASSRLGSPQPSRRTSVVASNHMNSNMNSTHKSSSTHTRAPSIDVESASLANSPLHATSPASPTSPNWQRVRRVSNLISSLAALQSKSNHSRQSSLNAFAIAQARADAEYTIESTPSLQLDKPLRHALAHRQSSGQRYTALAQTVRDEQFALQQRIAQRQSEQRAIDEEKQIRAELKRQLEEQRLTHERIDEMNSRRQTMTLNGAAMNSVFASRNSRPQTATARQAASAKSPDDGMLLLHLPSDDTASPIADAGSTSSASGDRTPSVPLLTRPASTVRWADQSSHASSKRSLLASRAQSAGMTRPHLTVSYTSHAPQPLALDLTPSSHGGGAASSQEAQRTASTHRVSALAAASSPRPQSAYSAQSAASGSGITTSSFYSRISTPATTDLAYDSQQRLPETPVADRHRAPPEWREEVSDADSDDELLGMYASLLHSSTSASARARARSAAVRRPPSASSQLAKQAAVLTAIRSAQQRFQHTGAIQQVEFSIQEEQRELIDFARQLAKGDGAQQDSRRQTLIARLNSDESQQQNNSRRPHTAQPALSSSAALLSHDDSSATGQVVANQFVQFGLLAIDRPATAKEARRSVPLQARSKFHQNREWTPPHRRNTTGLSLMPSSIQASITGQRAPNAVLRVVAMSEAQQIQMRTRKELLRLDSQFARVRTQEERDWQRQQKQTRQEQRRNGASTDSTKQRKKDQLS